MAITQVGSASTATSNAGANISVTAPAGIQSGDVLIAVGSSNKGTWDTLPSGFTQVAVSTDASLTNNFRSYVWYKVCGGSEPASYTFGSTTASGAGAPMIATITAWRGVDNSAPVPASSFDQTNTTTTNPTISISPTTTGRQIYAVGARSNPSTASTSMSWSISTSGWTELADNFIFSGGSTAYGMAVYVKNADDAAGGTFTEPTVTQTITSGTDTADTYFLVSLRADNTGTAAVTLGNVTSTFAGSVADAATVDVTLGNVTSTFAGSQATAGDFNGVTLQPLSVALSAVEDQAGSVSVTLGNVTSSFTAGVEPTGVVAAQLANLVVAVTVETVPFGSQVLHIPDEKRAFRITQDDMIDIYRSQATQL